MARLRYNGLSTTLGGSGLTNSATSVTFSAALTHSGGTNVPTISGSDYIPLMILDSNGHLSEVVWLTAYTAGATTGTIARGKEGTSGVSHNSGDKVVCSPVIADISAPALTPAALHATYGDHFDGSSLDAKWTRVTYVSGDEQYRMGNGTYLQVDTARAAGAYYYQAAPSGDFTVVMKLSMFSNTGVMFGPLILDSSGNGICASAYDNTDGHYVLSVSGGSYGGSQQNVGGPVAATAHQGRPVWLKLNKTGTAYKASISFDGETWRPWTSTLTFSTTPTRIGFGGILGTAISFAIDFFDVQ